MRVPGVAVLDYELAPTTVDGRTGTRLTQIARFRPRGLAGLLYWYAVTPLHGLIFRGLLRGIAEASLEPPAPTPPVAAGPPAGLSPGL